MINEGKPCRQQARREMRAGRSVPVDSVRLSAPLCRPRKFLGLGGNYASHLEEIQHLGLKIPETQIWFNKQTSCINGPFDNVVIPALSSQVDYEGELAVVIGRRCRHVPAERAREVIGGYSIFEQIAELSSVFTLEPGDILATGTPAGVGAARRPPLFLKAGDVVRVEIERIGCIENRFVARCSQPVIE